MNRPTATLVALTATTLLFQACRDQGTPTAPARDTAPVASVTSLDSAGRYLVVFTAQGVPADFGARVAQVGGTIEAALDSIGVAEVTGVAGDAVAQLAAAGDVLAVEPDALERPADDGDPADEDAAAEPLAPADATASPTAAQFYPRQWNMRAVFAPEAWAAGDLGSRDVKVAIVDTGIDYLLPDFVGLVDLEHSASFVPEDVSQHYPGRLPFSDLFWHGTAVASVVASNATVLAGLNRYVTLIAVKVVDSTFHSSRGRILNGIVYAADQGADVINVSYSLDVDKSMSPGTVAAIERAASYAFRKGALVIANANNDAADLDHDGDRVRLLCEAADVICASATGPTAAASITGPWENVDAIAPYTAFGRSAISVAAPGGAGTTTGFQNVWVLCTKTPSKSTVPLACKNGTSSVARGIGTSFSAPHVAGLAALLVAKLGHGNPALIRSLILDSADDLGEPGVDPYYGHGRINVARALEVGP